MKRIGWIAAVVVVVGALGLLLRPSAVPVETAPVGSGPLRVTVDEQGRTRVRERYIVSAPVGGRVGRIDSREGDEVRRGTLLAKIAPAPLDSRAREAAEAQLEAASDASSAAEAATVRSRATLDQARRERVRIQELATQNVATPEDLERAQLSETAAAKDVEAADFTAQAAAHQVELARAGLLAADPRSSVGGRVIEIRSPLEGRILRIPERSERVVVAGTPLLEVGDPSRIEIVAEILSTDAVRIRFGARAIISEWGGDEPLAAQVRTVEPSGFTKLSALGVEEQRVRVILDLVDPAPALADGFRVEVAIVVWEAPRIVKVPTSALFRTGSDWSVFAVSGGRARQRVVEIGHRNAFEAEVTSGLAEGEVVILHPSDKLADGSRVVFR
ncbi:MAG: HlyD family efflux transporter periplasmic adaptor subunit [Gemmatimonadetes bacterium]|nr:HlyD family efflux transporter periplasmic adaptor subunit [Gemmatimonadota bacterium]